MVACTDSTAGDAHSPPVMLPAPALPLDKRGGSGDANSIVVGAYQFNYEHTKGYYDKTRTHLEHLTLYVAAGTRSNLRRVTFLTKGGCFSDIHGSWSMSVEDDGRASLRTFWNWRGRHGTNVDIRFKQDEVDPAIFHFTSGWKVDGAKLQGPIKLTLTKADFYTIPIRTRLGLEDMPITGDWDLTAGIFTDGGEEDAAIQDTASDTDMDIEEPIDVKIEGGGISSNKL